MCISISCQAFCSKIFFSQQPTLKSSHSLSIPTSTHISLGDNFWNQKKRMVFLQGTNLHSLQLVSKLLVRATIQFLESHSFIFTYFMHKIMGIRRTVFWGGQTIFWTGQKAISTLFIPIFFFSN